LNSAEPAPGPTALASGAVVYAKDADRLAAFYGRVAGLAVLEARAGWSVLGSAAHQLVVHAIPPQIAASIEIAAPPERRAASALKLVFVVPSLAAARPLAAALGGVLDPPEREWVYRDSRVCDGHDPEGNVIQLREPARAGAVR
jgi:catechol 2,3-dioxygenase-like lactoylglutathione lyase family enzyme